MDIRKTMGANLRRIRLQAKLSQEELADRAGIDRTYMSGLERGLRNPSLLVMERIAQALGASIADLVTEQTGAEEEGAAK